MAQMTDRYDVVVLGGGAAGLSGALMLARSRRSVLVVDAGRPRNAPAEGIHGLLGSDGMSPAEYLERGRVEVRAYGGQLVKGEVSRVGGVLDEFTVELADGRTVRARRLLVASGLVDELPDVVGVQERWGRDILHCPYCHGWEVRDQIIGVLATGPMAAHQALLFSQLSADVTVLRNQVDIPDEQRQQLRARGIALIEGEVVAVEVADDRLVGVRLADDRVVALQALVVGTRMRARASFLADLGLTVAEHPSGMGEHLPVDPTGRTTVSGVWAAGNVTDLAAQVGAAAAAGAAAGAQINYDLVVEETRRALIG